MALTPRGPLSQNLGEGVPGVKRKAGVRAFKEWPNALKV